MRFINANQANNIIEEVKIFNPGLYFGMSYIWLLSDRLDAALQQVGGQT